MAAKLAALAAAVFTAFAALAISVPAHAATLSPGMRMLNWAVYNAKGHWYAWGGTGLSTYDCSGLVYRAAIQAGVSGIPRTTEEMLGSSKLVRTYNPQVGDLAFFGSGHVEIFAHGHDVTFGAQSTGTQVGYHTWNAWWHPTAFYKIL